MGVLVKGPQTFAYLMKISDKMNFFIALTAGWSFPFCVSTMQELWIISTVSLSAVIVFAVMIPVSNWKLWPSIQKYLIFYKIQKTGKQNRLLICLKVTKEGCCCFFLIQT